MPVYRFEAMIPVVDPTAFVHPTAVLIGDVIIGAGCYVGPGASLRGDFGRIILKTGSNVQDNCVMHSFPGQDAVVEEDGHVGRFIQRQSRGNGMAGGGLDHADGPPERGFGHKALQQVLGKLGAARLVVRFAGLVDGVVQQNRAPHSEGVMQRRRGVFE